MKTKRKVSPEAKAARVLLLQMSAEAKAKRNKLIKNASTVTEALAAEALTLNDLIIDEFKKQTGCDDFRTFHDWKKAGFSVIKGQKAFRIWGRPIKRTKETENNNGEITLEDLLTNPFWPTCCVFNEMQVQPINGDALPVDQSETREIVAVQQVVEGNPKLANKFIKAAATLQKRIDHCFSDRLANTPKRLAQSVHMRIEGEQLARSQSVLAALAELHLSGEVPEALATITTKAEIVSLMRTKKTPVANGYHAYSACTGAPAETTAAAIAAWSLIKPKSDADIKTDKLRAMQNDLKFSNIPGYFPTPADTGQRVIDEADINETHAVCDPSAGSGDLLDLVTESKSKTAYEINYSLAEILELKGYENARQDFTELEPVLMFDRIIMNPPFERLQDVDHVQHAFKFLKPGGRLVAIMSPGGFFRQDKKALAFREWLDDLGGEAVDLPENSFKASGTGVASKLVIIRKDDNHTVNCDDSTTENNPFIEQDYDQRIAAKVERFEDRAATPTLWAA